MPELCFNILKTEYIYNKIINNKIVNNKTVNNKIINNNKYGSSFQRKRLERRRRKKGKRKRQEAAKTFAPTPISHIASQRFPFSNFSIFDSKVKIGEEGGGGR